MIATDQQSIEVEEITRLYNENYDLIYRTISFRVGDPQTVEDLTNDVFTRLLTALKKNRMPEQSTTGWLLTVARHVVADFYRKNKRQNWVKLSEHLRSGDRSPADHVDQQLHIEQLRKAVNKLPDSQRAVLDLRFGAEMRVRDVATHLGKSEGSVKMLQARAIIRLAQEMGAR